MHTCEETIQSWRKNHLKSLHAFIPQKIPCILAPDNISSQKTSLLTHASRDSLHTPNPSVSDPSTCTHTGFSHMRPWAFSPIPITSLAHLPQTPGPCTAPYSNHTHDHQFRRHLLSYQKPPWHTSPITPPTHHTVIHVQLQRIFSSPNDHPGGPQASRPHSKPGWSRLPGHRFASPSPTPGPGGGACPRPAPLAHHPMPGTPRPLYRHSPRLCHPRVGTSVRFTIPGAGA